MKLDIIQIILTSSAVSALVATSVDYIFKYKLERKLRGDELLRNEYTKVFSLISNVDYAVKSVYSTPIENIDHIRKESALLSTAFKKLNSQMHRADAVTPKKYKQMLGGLSLASESLREYSEVAYHYAELQDENTEYTKKFRELQKRDYNEDINRITSLFHDTIKKILE
ncbi:MAG: hypothetical protein WD603_01855 [Patescibacteria group bacterium]